jgi:hypothetical protein
MVFNEMKAQITSHNQVHDQIDILPILKGVQGID